MLRSCLGPLPRFCRRKGVILPMLCCKRFLVSFIPTDFHLIKTLWRMKTSSTSTNVFCWMHVCICSCVFAAACRLGLLEWLLYRGLKVWSLLNGVSGLAISSVDTDSINVMMGVWGIIHFIDQHRRNNFHMNNDSFLTVYFVVLRQEVSILPK